MKRKSFLPLFIVVAFLGIFSACKKDDDNPQEPVQKDPLDQQFKTYNEDAHNYKAESDAADSDINASLTSTSLGRLPQGVINPFSALPCGCTSIDSTQIANKILIYHFSDIDSNGDTIYCGTNPRRTRSGDIKVQLMPGHNSWSEIGAVLEFTYIDYKVTRSKDLKFINFNGAKSLTNINGNNWLAFFTGTGNLKYKERAYNVQVSFSSGLTATWNTAHMSEWSYVPTTQVVTFNAIGDTSISTYNNVSAWGVNRFGHNFITNYNSPWTSNTFCGLWFPKSGELVHYVNNSTFTITLGVDAAGNTAGGCPYGFKVVWVGPSGTNTLVLPY
jgi:hypothetical protein